MATTIIWKIKDMKREIADGYVFTVNWIATATSDDKLSGGWLCADVHREGKVSLDRPASNMISYEDLTEEIVIGWVKNSLGIDEVSLVEQKLISAINEQLQPTVSNGIPWQSIE